MNKKSTKQRCICGVIKEDTAKGKDDSDNPKRKTCQS